MPKSNGIEVSGLANDLVLGTYLSANVTATSTTYIDSGLYVQLAANTAYFIDCVWTNAANGDGMKWKFVYSGTALRSALRCDYNYAPPTDTLAVGVESTNTQTDESATVSGLVVTSTAGTLKLQFAKNTDVTDDTPLLAGSCLTARRI